MKKFRFKFKAVEKVRRIATERQMKELALAIKAQEAIEYQIRELEFQLSQEIDRLSQVATSGEPDQMQELSVNYRKHLRGQIQKKRDELLTARQRVLLERRKLVEKSKDQKAIEKLKEKERDRYHDEVRKAEVKEMDEVAGSIWVHLSSD